MAINTTIARRLPDGRIQYGGIGLGGGLLGRWLDLFYSESEYVEYLFSLGQMRQIGPPFTEYDFHSAQPVFDSKFWENPAPHRLGATEREMFSVWAFNDVGYFYDWDGKWYYIKPGPFRIKIPRVHFRH